MARRPALLLALPALVGVATTHASSASAALIALDLFTAGDGLITRDTETGLDWLDLTASVNLSYNDVEADGGGWISLGFRHATGAQVCGLFAPHATAPSPCPGGAEISESGNVFATLQGFVGVTYSDARLIVASDGFYDDGDEDYGVGLGRVAYSFWTGRSSSSLFPELLAKPDTAFETVGHWLVRPVPEPSTALLLAAGLAALAVRRRWSAHGA